MAASFFFYDLETSGINPSASRIMQFAGIRTDENLEPIGEPVNLLIKLAGDVLPDPDAIMITGITPQQTLADGLTEAEFLKFFYDEVVKPETTFLGFNTVRFDDEFMRYLHYRNFYDAYEWQWCNDCSRWDILDLVRMTRALRPEGIEWPVTPDGKPTNRLELLTKANGLQHEHAHDALSDVYATIAVAKLIRSKQPELFDYMMGCRKKKVVGELVKTGQPFVYTTGRYASEYLHTSAAVLLADHPQQDCALVYDLRFDPQPFAAMSPEQLADCWRFSREPREHVLPVKTLKYNRCPAVAPLGVIKDQATEQRLQLPLSTAKNHYSALAACKQQLAQNVLAALRILEAERTATKPKATSVDAQLYDGFMAAEDKVRMAEVRSADPSALGSYTQGFRDTRLQEMLPLYKARNYPTTLTSEEREVWDAHCKEVLFGGGNDSPVARYFARLSDLVASPQMDDNKRYLLEELQLYGQSVLPTDGAD